MYVTRPSDWQQCAGTASDARVDRPHAQEPIDDFPEHREARIQALQYALLRYVNK